VAPEGACWAPFVFRGVSTARAGRLGGDDAMKIAISGAHRTGKTTLAEALGQALPRYDVVDEPYYLLEEEGHEFAAMPTMEDFELMLERSIEALESAGPNTIFDRCPADLLAYLITHEDADGFDPDRWLPRVRDAMEELDFIVLVPVEQPDRVPAADVEHEELR